MFFVVMNEGPINNAKSIDQVNSNKQQEASVVFVVFIWCIYQNNHSIEDTRSTEQHTGTTKTACVYVACVYVACQNIFAIQYMYFNAPVNSAWTECENK